MKVLGIMPCSASDGTGWRVVVFVSGCHHHCQECQNPESWDFNRGTVYDTEMESRILELLDHNYISGLTISGGDPLAPENLSGVKALIKAVNTRFNTYDGRSNVKKDIWIYTGYEFEDLTDEQKDAITNNRAVFLMTGRYVHELNCVGNRDYPWRGSSNQALIFVPARWKGD